MHLWDIALQIQLITLIGDFGSSGSDNKLAAAEVRFTLGCPDLLQPLRIATRVLA
jgi:hypothetical protein